MADSPLASSPNASLASSLTSASDEASDVASCWPEWCAWLRLLNTPGVGRTTARELMAKLGPPEVIFALRGTALRDAAGATLGAALSVEPDGHEAQSLALKAWLEGDRRRTLITLGDPHYPPLLMQTADPPLMLYAQGRLDLLSRPCLAIVGSRSTTQQGAENARAFARALSESGFTIVSGLALGIDAAAHEGALQGPGSTIAVIGTGLDRIYPARHATLARTIASQGLLLSEFALGTPPLREHFPQRNRVIAGLAQGTLVVEAALLSGSLITARQASEAGREVFAIPGSIHSPQSRGCHALIKQGAKLVENADDIRSELGSAWPTGTATAAQPSASHTPDASSDVGTDTDTDANATHPLDRTLLRALGFDPMTLDALIDRTGIDAASAQARLLELELDGSVERLPGGRYQRQARG